MKIKFVDLNAQYLTIKSDIDSAIQNVINESSYIKGKHVKSFENNFKKLYNTSNCISVANGTDSLFIIMKMLGIKKGDEVITSAYSWISSSETISLCGAKPIFVDIEKNYYTINPKLIESKISKRTKAIMVVHIHGQACNMNEINIIAKKYNLPIIEDCAQAHFAEYKGKYVGNFGLASSFSFFPGKNLGAYGDAGAIISKDNFLAKKFRMFANHGALIKHEHKIEGTNSRMDGMQAAILNVKLKYIKKWTKRRREIASYYNKNLQKIKSIEIPKVRPGTKHAYHLYVVKADKRNDLMNYMNEKKIQSMIHYPKSLPNLDCYKNLTKNQTFPISTANENKILSLPIYPELTKTDLDLIIETIKEFYKTNHSENN